MGKNANFVSHKKSKLIVDGKPKLPSAGSLVEGEIAINFAENVETLSIKNESGTVVTFSSDNYYSEQKLGSGFTGENSAVTVTDAILWERGEGMGSIKVKNSSVIAIGVSSYAEGFGTQAIGTTSHAEGTGSQAIGNQSHAEGDTTTASGSSSHSEGFNTKAIGDNSHAEGNASIASGFSSHAEGAGAVAFGIISHAEGGGTQAIGQQSHAEGGATQAYGTQSHAEGGGTQSNGNYSHAEGGGTRANGAQSHAEGATTVANGINSHTEGSSTVANNFSEHASGVYNVSSSASTTFGDSGNTLFSVGNGTDNNSRHNAFEIRQNGDIYIVKNGADVKLQDEIGNVDIEIDQVLDDSTSASTNPIATHAVYEVIAADELVWANAYVELSGTVATKQDASGMTDYATTATTNALDSVITAHTANTDIHVTTTDKTNWNAKAAQSDLDTLSGTVTGHTADTNIHVTTTDKTNWNAKAAQSDLDTLSGTVTGHTSDTDIHVTTTDKANWNAKLDSSDIANFFDDVKYEDSGTSKVINFYNGNTLKATIDADDFIVDGMISGVTLESKSGTTYLVINWNTAAGDQTTELNIGDIFEADNYYDKNSIDSIVGSGFTVSSITEVIESNERVIATSLNDLDTTKLDTSAFTSYSGTVDTEIGNKLNTADFNTYSGAVDTAIGTKAAQSDLEELSGTVSGHTVEITDLSGQAQTVAAALVYLNNTCTGLDDRVTTVENKNLTSGDVITALGYAPTNVVYTAVTVTADLNNQTCPVTLSANGQQCNVLYINNSTAHNVVISTTYKTPDGEPITLELAANGYGEVNYMYYDGDIYVKAS